MNCEHFLTKDYGQLCLWWDKRNLPHVSLKDLPITGYIVENVAAGFMYFTDSKLCFIEHFISNPDVPRETRDKALDTVVENLLLAATGKTVVSFSYIPAIIERSKRFGFKVHEHKYTMISKEI